MPFDRIALDNLPQKLFTQLLLPWQPMHSHRSRPVLCPSCTCHRRVFAPSHTWFDFSRALAT